MSKLLKNIVLKNDLKELTEKIKSIEITKGDISGNSIEIVEVASQSQSSYVYYDRVGDRDKDYDLLLELIESKIEKNEY
jgi:hypothetical protein